ncbi:hypothetical protein AB4Y63_11965 [Leifsonia sp. YAF41]|uniref:hypothetical protein n=1 Tax=Leifsonia sp. YAF41 TaxID=3233086 RepID=UPI003F9AD85A
MSSTGDNPLDPPTGGPARLAHETAEKLKGMAGNVAEAVGDVASRTGESAPDVGSLVQGSLDESAGFLRRQLRERPAVVVAATALAAFVVGLALGRKSMR